ncbi:MAG: hypothetical protein AAF236_14565, partial [Verrucomicrobiota bacterium]
SKKSPRKQKSARMPAKAMRQDAPPPPDFNDRQDPAIALDAADQDVNEPDELPCSVDPVDC